MQKVNSFSEYVRDKFYNEIYTSVESFFYRNKDSFDLTIPRFINQWGGKMSDAHILYVNAEDKDATGMRIDFYPIVTATIEIVGKTRYDIEQDTKDLWFRLHCSGDLSKQLADFTVHNIEQCNVSMRRKSPVTDTLIPYVRSTSLDDCATQILNEFYPEALMSPQRVDGSILAERMGLSIKKRSIDEKGEIFGQIYFYDSELELYDRKSSKADKVRIAANTIVIDSEVAGAFSYDNINMTIAHECVHYALHRKVFEFARLCNEDLASIQCGVVGQGANIATTAETEWMEWHATSIAPRIIMPLKTFRLKAEEFIANHLSVSKNSDPLEVMEVVIDELAEYFAVSRASAKNRMVETGFYEAMGAYTYCDGEYVKPHKPSKIGLITEKQTYSISRNDLACEILANESLQAGISSGRYVYVESHVVLNTPKYVDKTNENGWQLSKYARYHMDECCLTFDVEILAKHNISENYVRFCILNRDINSPYELQIRYHNGYELSTDEKQQAYLRQSEIEAQSVYCSLPKDLKGTIEALKKWRKASNYDLADEIGCDERTIRRIINGEKDASIYDILAICFALRLTPNFTADVLGKAGRAFKMADIEHWNLSILVNIASGKSMKEVRREAQRLGITQI